MQHYTDKKGNLIIDGSIVKVFQFTGVNERGNGRKHYYSYKLIKFLNPYWVGIHLSELKNMKCLPTTWEEYRGKDIRFKYVLPFTKQKGDDKWKQVPNQLKDYEVVE